MAVRTIGTDIKLTGEKEFNDGMKSINSNLKTLRSDMAAASAQFEENADSVEALTAKNQILQESVDQQRYKVDALKQMHQKMVDTYGEDSAAADKYKQQLNNAVFALAKEEKALKQNEAALEDAKAATAAAENAAEELADAAEEVADSAEHAADELEDMGDKAEKTESKLPAVAQGFGNVAAGALKAAAAVASVAAAAGTAAVTAMISFAKESAEAAKAAEEAGETLLGPQRAWLTYANSLDDLDDAVTHVKQALGGVLLPQLRTLSREGATYLGDFAQSLEEAAGDSEKQSQVISEYLVRGMGLIQEYLPEYASVGRNLLKSIKDGFAEVAPELMDQGVDLVFDLLDGLIESAPELGEGGEVLFEKIKTALEDRGPDLVFSAAKLIGQLAAGVVEHAADLIPVAGDLIGAVVLGLVQSLPELGTAAGKMIGSLARYLTDPENWGDLGRAALEIGEAIAEAIWNGLVALWNEIADIPGLVEGLNAFGAASGAGTVITVPGHADGLDRVPYDNYLARLHKDEMVLTAAEAALYRKDQGSKGSGANVNLTFNVKQLTQEDVEMVIDLVNRKLGDDL